MNSNDTSYWLDLARELQSLAQTGLAFQPDAYDQQRYHRLLEMAAEIVARQTTLATAPLVQNFQLQRGYATPKIDVRGAVIRDHKILLVQEMTDHRWAMPGGWADVGESPAAMVEREVWEESGFRVQAKKVIAVYDANRDGRPMEFYHAYKIIFQCDILSGAPRPSDETLAVDFFDWDQLPELSVARTNLRHLTEVFAHARQPGRPVAFD